MLVASDLHVLFIANAVGTAGGLPPLDGSGPRPGGPLDGGPPASGSGGDPTGSQCHPCHRTATHWLGLQSGGAWVPRLRRAEEQAELVGDFTIAAAAIMVAVNTEDILYGAGEGP